MAAAYVRRHAAATESPQDDSSEDAAPQDGESQLERLTRNWNELLQELRVAQTGVQILTGFLLTIPFTDRFTSLDDWQRTVYLCVLVGSVVTTCVIVGPVSFHRILFRQNEKPWLVRAANLCARAGLVLLAFVSSGVVLFVFDVVVGTTAAIVASVLVFILFVGLWLVTPLLARD
ncbi:DUF6328 family protein [Nocardioides bizhenqiangii]|uniref:DUF6328 family protein n=1 Tax=Nocardioides bizhenqiangii TaxID=3095076 RepID=A0ABZ0ZS76_9ACTN|nr:MULTISPECIES: DUF6328 family protein [unclassified Nocardioides]MDZ5623522.1 DUF6328 family protein [Nocardioides sp. HM23]WQQ27193.1 DUF6328 family protein [Nocardioides sp. HM61]